MTTLLNGLLGGLVVGVVATLAAQVAGVLLGGADGPRRASRSREIAAQVAYGVFAGLALVALELFVLGLIAIPPTVAEAFGVAVGWSAVLLVALLVARRVGGTLPFGRPRLAELLAYHLVYGVALGGWIRLTWIT